MNTLYLDIETNLAHDTIWLVCAKPSWYNDEDMYHFKLEYNMCIKNLQDMINDADKVVAHNLIGFDGPVLKKVWGVTIPVSKVEDTLIMSRLLNPNTDGGHSLKAWGKKLGFDKMDFDVEDFNAGWSPAMERYCQRDVEVLERLHKHLLKQFDVWPDATQSLELEHKTAIYMKQQEDNGFLLDLRYCLDLLVEMRGRMVEITMKLQEVFPPIVEERWSEKTGKRLKDRVIEFNVGSRKQIAARLQGLGVKFEKMTEKGSIIVDETVLKSIDLPEAKLIAEYLMLQKRVGMLDSWVAAADNEDRVHGRVISNGAVTGRMTHSSPNMGQITSVKSEYGKESRSCWTVPTGKKLVGCDLSGIEMRCLAHYCQDEELTYNILDGDVHTANQKAAGLPTRDDAKTFIYALMYGAGAAKIGSIVGGSSKQGMKLINQFMDNMPAMSKLIKKVQRMSGQGYLPALDGRRVIVRSEHSALNTLLQSAAAVVAKQWCVEIHKKLKKERLTQYVKQVAFVHDEIQMEVDEAYADRIAFIMVDSARVAGEVLGFRVPVDAEAKIGDNWYMTH